MDDLIRDIRYGLRMLANNRAFTAIAVLTLALGIGANSAIFSVVNAVLLRPLPVRDPDRVATVVMNNAKFNATGAPASFELYSSWKQNSRLFESAGAAASGTAVIDLGGNLQPVKSWRVSASFLPTLGVRPVFGRNFSSDEDAPGAAKVAILSNSAWRSMFAADPRMLGNTVNLDGVTYTVIGVLPRGFHVDGRPADFYTPIARSTNARDWLAVDVYARLKPGVTVEQATAELTSMSKEPPGAPFRWVPQVWKLRDFQVRDVRLSLLVLLGAVGLVLLIACANTASLLLARANAREQEIAVREALGAGRGRLLRQLLTESMILGLLGGVCGAGLAAANIRLIPLLAHERLPGLLEQTSVDGIVLMFTIATSLLTGLAFGAAPAFASTRILKSGGRTGSPGRNRVFHALVITETALALILAIGATLLIRTFFYLRDVAPGFRVDGLVIATVNAERGKFATGDQCAAYYGEIAGSARRIPGVRAVTFASNLPLTGELASLSWPIEGHHFTRAEDAPILWHRSVDTDYFQTMQIPLLRGRFFSNKDSRGAPRVVIVNEAFTRRFWPGQDPIGKHMGSGQETHEVVGVIRDVRSQDSTKDAAAEIYFHYPQSPSARVTLAIRADAAVYRNPLAIEPAIRQAVATVDSRQPVTKVAEIQQVIADRIAPKRLSAQLVAAFAGLAVFLAAAGIYGVLSFTVARQTHDIGIRIALGAERGSLLRMVIGQASGLSGAGVVIGIAAALGLTRILKSLIYGVSATDPWVYAAAACGTVALAIIAALLPAWRATRIDPVRALRNE